MKFDILHRTRYTYAAPARDSFNDVRLEPPSIPEQKVESFLLRVLPAVRLRHYVDFTATGFITLKFQSRITHCSLKASSRLKPAGRKPLPTTRNFARSKNSATRWMP